MVSKRRVNLSQKLEVYRQAASVLEDILCFGPRALAPGCLAGPVKWSGQADGREKFASDNGRRTPYVESRSQALFLRMYLSMH